MKSASHRNRGRSRLQVQVTLLWHDDVAVSYPAGSARGWFLGEPMKKGCAVAIPSEVLGAHRVPFLEPRGRDAINLVVHPWSSAQIAVGEEKLEIQPDPSSTLPPAQRWERVRLTAGTEAIMRIGAFGLRVTVEPSERRFVPQVRSRDWKVMPPIGASLVLHVMCLLAVATFFGAEPVDARGVTEDQLALMRKYLHAAAEREIEMKETETTNFEQQLAADLREGGTGTRAKGEEGSMGRYALGGHNKRYGVAGPQDNPGPHIARSAALLEAAEYGMIGTLGSGPGGGAKGNMWGSNDSLGTFLPGGNAGGIGHGAGSGAGQGFGSGRGRGTGAGQGFGSGHGRKATVKVAPAEVAIDPNGRFATTYRPGKGYLASFESAVARGTIPKTARELVADIGASYTPEIPAPTKKALAVEARLERAKLSPNGGPFHVRFAFRSSATVPSGRSPLSVHLVLDASGSMNGESLARAKQATHQLIDRLAPTDSFSMVTFSNSASRIVREGAVGPRRASIHRVINEVQANGGTNLGAGLRLAYQEAQKASEKKKAVPIVIVLSDGQANEGETRRSVLSGIALEAFQSGIQTSALGLGADYDGELMSAIAADGAGGYYYLADSDQIGPAIATELKQRLEPAATAVEVRVRLAKGIKLLHVYGSRRLDDPEAARVRATEVAADEQAQNRYGIKKNRQIDTNQGMRFFIPAFARNDAYALLLKLSAPAGVKERDVAVLELRYKDRIAGKNQNEEMRVRAEHANSDAASAATADGSVAQTVQGFMAGESLLTAAAHIHRGQSARAVAILSEREAILRSAAKTLNHPKLASEATRFARLRSHASGGEPWQESRTLALLLETAGRAHLR